MQSTKARMLFPQIDISSLLIYVTSIKLLYLPQISYAMNDQQKIENLKFMYSQILDHHKYYLTWRQLLFGGYLLILYTLLNDIPSLQKEGETYQIAYILFAVTFLSFIFLLIDRRNVFLFHSCGKIAQKIEQIIFENDEEKAEYLLFTYLRNNTKKTISHTLILTIFYSLIALSSLIGGIAIIINNGYCTSIH